MAKLRTITSLRSLKGRRVLVRLSLNIPITERYIENDFRLRRNVPTLKYLSSRGAKVVGIGHLGRDKDELLRPVVRYMNKFISVGYLPDQDRARTSGFVNSMSDGSIFILENLRRFDGETQNSPEFAKSLASLGDIYVNDAFSVSHRKHASIVGLPKFLPSYAGLAMKDEIEGLSRVFKAKRPFIIVLGGAKFKTKLPLVRSFIKRADAIFISGALANTFFKELGYETGRSLALEGDLIPRSFLKNKKIILPRDVVVKNRSGTNIKSIDKVRKNDNILDIGPLAVAELINAIGDAKTVVWNGPLGHFESGFDRSTRDFAKALAKSNAYSVIGGGDSVSAIGRMDLESKFSFVSTGGGAMLDFLADGTLPGIEAVGKSRVK